jgi:hypothetical protein
MVEARPMLVGAATVFVVSDIAKSIAYYRDSLGFDVTFQYGEPLFYACLCRDPTRPNSSRVMAACACSSKMSTPCTPNWSNAEPR